MKSKFLIYVLLGFMIQLGYAQLEDDFNVDDYYVITDTVKGVELDPVVLLPKKQYYDRYSQLYYAWFRKKTYKAYPYAIMAKQKLDSLDTELATITSKRKRKRYIKKRQKYLESTFTDRLKKLTRTEGRILFKLIYRQTGKTLNEHVQDKRGKFRAFLYRTTASFFKLNLKLEYHPDTELEDYMIERILHEAFINGSLQEHDDVLGIDILSLSHREIKIKKKK